MVTHKALARDTLFKYPSLNGNWIRYAPLALLRNRFNPPSPPMNFRIFLARLFLFSDTSVILCANRFKSLAEESTMKRCLFDVEIVIFLNICREKLPSGHDIVVID